MIKIAFGICAFFAALYIISYGFLILSVMFRLIFKRSMSPKDWFSKIRIDGKEVTYLRSYLNTNQYIEFDGQDEFYVEFGEKISLSDSKSKEWDIILTNEMPTEAQISSLKQ